MVSLTKRCIAPYARSRWPHYIAAQPLMGNFAEIGFSQTEREGMWHQLGKGDMNMLRFVFCAPGVLADRRSVSEISRFDFRRDI